VLHAERYIEELKDVERAFPQAPREAVAQTASRMTILTFPPGAVVMRQGEPSDRFYVIAKGEAVVVHREPDGSERTLNTLHPGEYFGEVGILTGNARNASVLAKTSLEILALDADGLRSLMSSSQKTSDEVARVAQSRQRVEDGAAD
jgi:CRP-like cAMP-binding protein